MISSLRCAGQVLPPLQRATAWSDSRTTGEPHTGQRVGSSTGWAPATRRSSSTRATSGMTSPARRITTVSPSRTSLRLISSMLCKVALLTVTPPTNVGARRATGVSAPVLPT